MASIKMVSEDDAVGRVKAIYDEIKQVFAIDFVPNLYRVMASNPDYLESNWAKGEGGHVCPGQARSTHQG